jgi:membrane-associated protein
MELITTILEWVLHLDTHLAQIIQQFGGWTYGILFFVIFMETGFVVTPFLPGDSLLFAAGALAASTGAFDMVFLFVLMFIAAFAGDSVNYWIGHTVGPKAFTGTSKLFKKEYLERTQAFYEKHGGKTILLARFIPIIRTFAPFVAGIGKMRYGYFITYNIVGGFLWTGLFLFGGYFFGNLPFVSDNFSLVVIAIILISLIPAVVEVLRNRKPAVKIESETPIE